MKFVVTSMFGALEELRSGVKHTGYDLAMPKGTTLRTISDGVVERVTSYGSKNIGNGVIIRTEDGSTHIFGHMDKVTVKPGQHIHSGDVIGTSGNSGNVFSSNGGDGAHLHFGVWKDGQFVDPANVIEKVDAYAGNTFHLFQGHGLLTNLITGRIKEQAKETTQEAISGVLEALGEAAVELSYSTALIGGGILILLKMVGFEHRWLKPGVLVLAHVLIKFL
jgi:hypothetical protein